MSEEAIARHLTASDIEALKNGAIAITATQRLAATLQKSFAKTQQGCWERADILPLTAWFKRLWEEALIEGKVEHLALINEHQARWLWEKSIQRSALGQRLLRPQQTAEQAMKTWGLIQAWQIDWHSEAFSNHRDAAVFQEWADDFLHHCELKQWIDTARLPNLLIESLDEKKISIEPPLLLFGFDQITPQLQKLLAHTRYTLCEPPSVQAKKQRTVFPSLEDEIRAMACWAKKEINQSSDTLVGCIIPNLNAVRESVQRIFTEVLEPESLFPGQYSYTPIFNISASYSLSEFPLIATALNTLSFNEPQCSLQTLGDILRSPFIGGASKESSQRANLDAALQHFGDSGLSFSKLLTFMKKTRIRHYHTDCPQLREQLNNFPQTEEPLSIHDWAVLFSKQLNALGWPGDQALDSHEHQLIKSFEHALDLFSSQTTIHPEKIDFQEAIKQLNQCCQTTLFQFKSGQPKIHILGMLEAAGLCFDGVWVAGLHASQWPSPANPNPFIPLEVQREFDLPHSSAERELRFSQTVMQRLLASAPNLYFSHAENIDQQQLLASPLTRAIPLTPYTTPEKTLATHDQPTEKLEKIRDTQAPAIEANQPMKGGSQLIKLQAACPFRAFATLRLGARAIPDTQVGLNARERGELLHGILEDLWKKLTDHKTLCEYTDQQLIALIGTMVPQQIASLEKNRLQPFSKTFIALETARLQKILTQWLNLEKDRKPFEVIATEQRSTIQLKALELRVSLDRIDAITLKNGEKAFLIIDYKTGKPQLAAWMGDRPDEPQLPLYAVTSQQPISGILFAQIRPEQQVLKGIVAHAELAETSKIQTEEHWREQQTEWKTILETLAEDFLAGNAAVDPKNASTCQYCDLSSLCRIEYD